MQRTSASGSVAGLFSPGNPALGQLATQLDADWYNDLQENICRFIEAAGIVLSPGDYSQFAAAIQTRLGNIRSVHSLNANTVLTAADCGKLFEVPTSGVTITLPAAAALPAKVIYIYNNSTGDITIAAGNFNSAFGTGTSTITVPSETSGMFICDGTSWNALAGAMAVGSAVKPRTSAGVGQWVSVVTGGSTLSLPAGGTWAYFASNNGTGYIGIAAGGATIFSGTLNNAFGFCWRIA